MDKPECGIESGYNPYRRRGLPGQKMDKPECGIERALTPAKMPKVHLVRRWISPSAGLKALHKTHNQRARSVRRWISPSAGLKDPSPRWVPSTGERQKMDKPECGIPAKIWGGEWKGKQGTRKKPREISLRAREQS